MVRILRSTLMVRVGGGWIALDEFLVKNDPCRGGYGCPAPGAGHGAPAALRPGGSAPAEPRRALAHVWWPSLRPLRCLQRHVGQWCPRGTQPTGFPGLWDPQRRPRSPPPSSPVKGRTNLKINEKYLSPDAFGAAAAKCAGNQSAPSSKVLSPSRSNSSLSLYSSASAPSSPLARKVRVWGAPPEVPTPPAQPPRVLTLSLPSRCCGGRAPETGAPVPAPPCCPTERSCSSARPRRPWPWHPQVRGVGGPG